jgi:K+-sensing histidine kinase KdpD
VHNLLVNAIQHGGENVEIRVDQAELVHVTIADDGKGLPDNWTTVGADTALPVDTIPHRIGLGISVAQSLIELMGGGMEYRRADGWAGWELTVPASPAPREPFGYTHEVAGTATG